MVILRHKCDICGGLSDQYCLWTWPKEIDCNICLSCFNVLDKYFKLVNQNSQKFLELFKQSIEQSELFKLYITLSNKNKW